MKKCYKCKSEKPDSEFYVEKTKVAGSTKLSSFCKPCMIAYQCERYVNKKIKAIKYKGNQCADCSLRFDGANYYLFDFHHLDPSQKDMDWNRTRLQKWDRIVEELDKCVILCANCHRTRHYNVGTPGIEPD